MTAGASGACLVNDLLDFPHDRRRPTKRRRPVTAVDDDPVVFTLPDRASRLTGLLIAAAFLASL